MDRWNGKHPIPYDFFYTFDDVVGENMSWFWNNWFFQPGYPDLAIGDIVQNNEEMSVKINRLGNVPVPVSLKIIHSDDSEMLVEEKADIWKDGRTSINLNIEKGKIFKRLELGNKYIPDIDQKNNTYIFED